MSEWERWQQIKTGAFITRWNANRVGALTLWTSKKVSDPRATMQRSATFAFTTSGTTFGTRLADSGASTPTIMDLMGHSQMTTSARYTHATDHCKRRAVEALARYAETIAAELRQKRKEPEPLRLASA